MNHSRYPLRFNVGFLLGQAIGTYRDIHFEYPEIFLRPDLELSNFTGVARVSRTPQGILVQGDFQATAPAQCVRCLTDFSQTLHTNFSDLYAFDQRSVTEFELILPEDGNINLEPTVREAMLIEFPISPICKEDCKGLCPVCGQNLNEELYEHDHTQPDLE